MATGYSIGRLGWVIPIILFQANITAAGRVKNEHSLSQYSFEGVTVIRLHLKYGSAVGRLHEYCRKIGVHRKQP